MRNLRLQWPKVFALLVLVLLSRNISRVIGSGYKFGNALSILSILAIIALLNSTHFTKKFLFLPIMVIVIIYSPFGLMYGVPNQGLFASLMETNALESFELLGALPLKAYMQTILTILLALYTFLKIKPSKKSSAYLIVIILGLLATQGIKKNPLINFADASIASVTDYYDDKKRMSMPQDISKQLKILEVKPKYQNYVLIIGESVRRDYMSLYGYPLKTTPFLDSVNGKFVSDFISAGPNTISSLTRMLTLYKGGDIDYNNDIISLANAAKFDTYWLSNQGFIGEHDSTISTIAVRSKNPTFIKKGGYDIKNVDDFLLAPLVKDILEISSEDKQPKLIVLHIMGSHPDCCQRLMGEEPRININLENKALAKNLSCYLSSIERTDKFVKQIYQDLKESGDSFSLLYLSDHGISRIRDSYIADVKNKQNYDTPLVVLSSDDTKRTMIKAKKSGFNFFTGMANWLGIRAETLDPHYSLFDTNSDRDIRVFNMNKIVAYDSLYDDHPIFPY